MPSNDSTVRFKADISQLKSQMQAAERQIKLVNSEFKAATAGMDDWSKSADGLSAKTKQLAGVLDGQNKKLELMEKELEATVKVYGENSAAADRVRIKINEQKAAIAKTESQLKTYEGKLEDLAKGMDEAADGSQEFVSATDKLKNSISEQQDKLTSLKKHYSDLVAEGKDLTDEAQNTAKEISELSSELQENKTKLSEAENAADEFDNSLDEMDDSAQKASDGFSVMRGALADLVADGIRATIDAVKDLAKETFEVGSNFESAMSQVAAVSGAGADEVEQLTAKAEEMGAKTKFSATESAEAFNYMAMAGWKTEDMLNGIEGIMNLAAASGADLATSSDIVTDALTAMGYGAEDAGRLADVLAAASSNANTNVEMMGGTFKYAAPLVGALGYSMEDTALASGLMANAGIKAEKAGTALRSIFSRLSAPPKECAQAMRALNLSLTDGDGKMKDFSVIMEELREKFANLSETEQTATAKHLAGQEAMSGLLAIVNAAPEDYEKLKDAIYNSSGAAEKMAETMQDNVGGQLVLLKSKIEGIMIKLFNRATGSMRSGIDTVGAALDKVNWDKVGDSIGNIANKAADMFSYVVNNSDKITSIVKTLAGVLGTIFISNKIVAVTTAISGFIGALTAAKTATEGLSVVTKLLGINMAALPIMAVVGALVALIAHAQKQHEETQKQIEDTYGLTEAQKALIETGKAAAEANERADETRKQQGENINYEYEQIGKLKDQYNDLIDENGKVKEGYEDLADSLLTDLASALGTTVENIKENIEANGKLGKSIDELIEKKKQEAKLEAFEPQYKEALQNELKYFQDLKKSKEEQQNAQEKLNEAQAEYDRLWNSLTLNPWKNSEIMKQINTEAIPALEKAQETLNQVNANVEQHSANWGKAQADIEFYQNAMAASTEGNVDKMNDSLLSLQYGLKNSTVATETELKSQWLSTKTNLEDIEKLYKEGKVSPYMVEEYRRVNQLAGQELDKWVAKNRTASADGVNAFESGLNAGMPRVTVTAGNLGMGSRLALFDNMGDWGDIADEKTDDYIGAIDSKKPQANQSGSSLAKATADGAKSGKGEFKSAANSSADAYTGTFDEKESDFTATGAQVSTATSSGAADKKDQFATVGTESADEYRRSIYNAEGEFDAAGLFTGDITSKGAQKQVTLFKNVGDKSSEQYVDTIASKSGIYRTTGKQMLDTTSEGASAQTSVMRTPGENGANEFVSGINSKKDAANSAGSSLAASANDGLGSYNDAARESGHFFGQGFVDGIGDLFDAVWNKAKELAKKAWDGLKAGQEEGSPSKLTHQSGRYFGEGFRNGIQELTKDVVKTATQLGVSAVMSLREAQQEGSPSKLTFKSGQNFTLGFIKGISSLDKALTKTTKKMVTGAVKQIMVNSKASKVTQSAEKASKYLSDAMASKMEYASGWMSYKNARMLEDFDRTIEGLQKSSDKEVAKKQRESEKKQKAIQKQIDAIKKVSEKDRTEAQKAQLKDSEKKLASEQKALDKATAKIQASYDKQIKTQQKMKASYQQASASLISEFTSAMNDYQTAAQDLIDSTLGKISTKYEAKYDALLSKQNNLISKLKESGRLFGSDDLNIMTKADLTLETKQIKSYGDKLKKIKGKVSSDLFEQIASYDMKEGEAFVNRLLSMSKKELNAYNAAYTKRLEAADKLAKSLYRDDFTKLDKDYKKEVKDAFKGLDKDLEKIGKQTLKGFVTGLTGNTNYMDSEIKTFIKGMIKTFKKELGIKSPSKVTKKIGAYTAEGFAKGISDNADMVEKAISDMTVKVENTFDWTRLASVDGFTDAMAEFENTAKEQITNTINKIGTTYQTKFDALLSKQQNLSKKLKGTGELYTLSSANVMKIVDVNAQIKEMQAYTKSLSNIKGKVSGQLFDEITSYNMKEGKAFVDRLLAMSDKELKAYSKAYDKKMSLADSLSQDLYRNDLDKVAKQYDAAMTKAFSKLPAQLKKLGNQSIQGFIKGLGGDSKYVKTNITNVVNGIINTFKKELGIHSPSKVMEELGEYTGEGFADGILSMVNTVKDAAREITDAVTSSLNWQDDISGARGTLKAAAGATGANRSAGSFAGASTQIINFNQTNNSPKALDRLTLYRQTNNMLFSAKVRLADV